jgi:hypothetical protein
MQFLRVILVSVLVPAILGESLNVSVFDLCVSKQKQPTNIFIKL